MVNIKTLLDTRRAKSDGSFNVIFRLTHHRKVYTVNSGISVQETFWDPEKSIILKTHPNAKLLNFNLTKEYFKIQEATLKIDEQDFNIHKLRVLINRETKNEVNNSFKAFSELIINQMMDVNRTGNAIVYKTAVNRLLAFYGNDNLTFKQLDYVLLDKFSHHLAKNGLKQNSISNYFRSIRAIYNKAIKAKIVERADYPFTEITIKSEATAKRAISSFDIKELQNLPVEKGTNAYRSLNCFMLSYYLRGISFTDMAYLTNDNIIGDRLYYKRRKTHKNYNVKLYPQALEVLDELKFDGCKYLLPILKNDVEEDSIQAKKIIQQFIKVTNKHLKSLSDMAGLNSCVTTYTTRHSFATRAKKLGYSNELIAEALGHQYGNKITNIYLDDFDTDVVDAMHLKVISL
jgi:integrase/recombinase XerD